MIRGFDVVIAAVLLLLCTPLIALAALAIVIDSKGPILFRQERIGKGMRPFRILKLRTMAADAAAQFDFRAAHITRVGRLLRKWKVDELPQLWNVLRGEMSMVGPRPEIAPYVELFRPEYEKLLRSRPGLTDPATIAFRHEAELLSHSADPEKVYVQQVLPQKLKLAIEYAERRSLASDLHILLRTVIVIFR
jgi:lipopolysaccharide/colanic/teichoic acid biosynthesis glycosyltransferase